MLSALKFVKGAVARKDYQPALTHFRISDGRVTGYNGTIALSSPIDLDLDAAPKAIPFVKAIERCSDTMALSITPTGKLFVKSGSFRAHIECTDDAKLLDAIVPEGDAIAMATDIIPALRVIEPFISTDASRPWAMGVLLRDYSAYATNNIILAEYWIGKGMPNINMPASAISELTRIGEEPIGVQLGPRSITFHFSGERWLRSQLLNTEWPDIQSYLDRGHESAELQSFPEGFFDAVDKISAFVEEDGRIFFREGKISTAPADGAGSSVDIAGLPAFGAYHHHHLMSLAENVKQIDFTKHPQPCPFYGHRLRGIFQGMSDL